MRDPLASKDDAGTPLGDDEREGLIPSYITLRSELNEAEQANILQAEEWAFARERDVLDSAFLDKLHQKMFCNVWNWAGQHRTTGKNIGVDAYRIKTDIQQLTEDSRYQIENETYEPDEIAARFHHRLVSIHPYPNGNGRHARLAADLLLTTMKQDRFSWGSKNPANAGELRARYIAARQAADAHDIGPLLEFVRL